MQQDRLAAGRMEIASDFHFHDHRLSSKKIVAALEAG